MANHRPSVKPIGFVAWGPSSSQMMMVKTQCHATTTSKLKARMKSTYRSRPSPLAVAGGLVAVFAIANILTNRMLPAWTYVPFNLLVAVAVVRIASTVVTPSEMGFTAWRRGARWGLALAAATMAVYVVALVVPATRGLFEDRRLDEGVPALLYNTLIAIPLGTVVLEEIAFRGALPAVLSKRWTRVRAVVVSSLLFGLWHVLPSWGIGDVNPVVDDLIGAGWVGRTITVALAVAGTFLVGLWWCFVRYRSGSLLAPVLAHVATNSLAYAIAWTVS